MGESLRLTRLYGIWANMKQRCYNPKAPAYKSYGAKGVTICEDWQKDFNAFAEWSLTHGYEDPPIGASKRWITMNSKTIDRIDATKGYSPENCQWISFQANRERHSGNSEASKNTVCLHLRTARQNANLSQFDVSKRTGINNKSISNWENGVAFPSILNAITLAKLYGVTVDELIGANA